MKDKICGIYKITNTINGKSYIGQSIDIERRWRQHKRIGCSDCSNKYKRDKSKVLYLAIQKYGLEAFQFEVIEECDKEFLYEREQYWINALDTTTRNNHGYNLNDGGAGGSAIKQQRSVYQYDVDGKFICSYNSIAEANRAMGDKSDSNSIQNSIDKEHRSAHGYQWRSFYAKNITALQYKSTKKNIAMYTSEGDFVRTFNGAMQAAKFVDRDKTAITANCCGKTILCGGYVFRYFEEYPLNHINVDLSYTKRGQKPRKIAQYTPEGKLLHIYDSAKEASIVINGDASAILKCCNHPFKEDGLTLKIYKKSIWRFYMKGGVD